MREVHGGQPTHGAGGLAARAWVLLAERAEAPEAEAPEAEAPAAETGG